MGGIWAVARHTFSQCLRMKLAGVFIATLAVSLVVLPLAMEGDGTLAGKVRTLLSYGVSITSVLLSVVTIFLAVSVVATDIGKKHVFLVASKPLARWQYVVGRWGGVVMFDAMLLAVAAIGVYVLSQHLRDGEALNDSDRRAVETEVFTARQRVPPGPLDRQIAAGVEKRIHRLRQDGKYDETMEAYKVQADMDATKADEKLRLHIRKEIASELQAVAPGRSITWEFSGVRAEGRQMRGAGTAVRVDRARQLMWIDAPPRLMGQLVYQGPVGVNGIDGRVDYLPVTGPIGVRFTQENMARLLAVTDGKEVRLVTDPTIQIEFTTSLTGQPPDGLLYSAWVVMNPSTRFTFREFRSAGDPPRLPVVITVSARVVDEDGRVDVTYVNQPNPRSRYAATVSILQQDIAVLYRVGPFEGNFLRGVALVMVRLMYLAGLGICAGTFLSFSVGSLVCFATLPFSLGREFLADAVKYPEMDLITRVGYYIFKSMGALLPDLESTSPAQRLVDGMNISWASLGETGLWTIVIRTGLLLAIGCLVFRKRELARVQV